MSIKCMTRVWDYSQNKGSALLLLLAIADYASDDGTNAWPAVKTLAEKTRMTQRNVQLLLRKLEESGELITHEGEGRHGTNLYTVNVWPERGGENFSGGEEGFMGGVKEPSPLGVKSSAQGGEEGFTRSVKNHHAEPSLEPSINKQAAGSVEDLDQDLGTVTESPPPPQDEDVPFVDLFQDFFHRKPTPKEKDRLRYLERILDAHPDIPKRATIQKVFREMAERDETYSNAAAYAVPLVREEINGRAKLPYEPPANKPNSNDNFRKVVNG